MCRNDSGRGEGAASLEKALNLSPIHTNAPKSYVSERSQKVGKMGGKRGKSDCFFHSSAKFC